MIEKKIYAPWAFKENEREKGRVNREIYKEITQTYRVTQYFSEGRDRLDDYDVALSRKPGYHHSVYTILKNEPGLSRDELALIADGGNLCFGYMDEPGGKIHVFED